jgi:hypothetical protein
MVTKHIAQNVTDAAHNVTVGAHNITDAAQNVMVGAHNITDGVQNVSTQLQCDKCCKVFVRRYHMTRHIKNCKGPVSSLQCQYCNKLFKHASGKSAHCKICPVKAELDSKALVVVLETPVAVAASVPQIVTNNIDTVQTQIQTQNNTHIQTQNNINIVVYTNDDEGMTFRNDHIDTKRMKKLLIPGDDKIEPEKLSGVVRDYAKQLLACKENQCVKKTNMRSSHSHVHVGNDTWESRQDKDVYPNMMNNISNDFSGFLHLNYKAKFYKTLDKFIDYMASDGYCADEEMSKEIEKCFKNNVAELKLIIFDICRESKKTREQPVK